jgi:hypothetical protein
MAPSNLTTYSSSYDSSFGVRVMKVQALEEGRHGRGDVADQILEEATDDRVDLVLQPVGRIADA